MTGLLSCSGTCPVHHLAMTTSTPTRSETTQKNWIAENIAQMPTFAVSVPDEPVGMCQLAPADVVQWHVDRLIWQAELVQVRAIIIRQQTCEGGLIRGLQLHREDLTWTCLTSQAGTYRSRTSVPWEFPCVRRLRDGRKYCSGFSPPAPF